MSITLDAKNVLFLAVFFLSTSLVLSASLHSSFSFIPPFYSSLTFTVVTNVKGSPIISLLCSFAVFSSRYDKFLYHQMTSEPQLHAFPSLLVDEVLVLLFTLWNPITKNRKKYWQHFLCCIILFVFFFSDLFHSRIDSVLMILYCTPLPNMEGESEITRIRQ